MYEIFYGLKDKPFRLSPDYRFFFESQSHKRAMAYLRYGIEQKEGFIVITGGVGTGKTTLVEMLFNVLKQEKKERLFAAKLVSTQLKADDLLRMICAAFGLPHEQVSKAGMLNSIEGFFYKKGMNGERVLLVIDEAQNIPRKSLEELRMLSNIQPGGMSVLQTFLLGQDEFLKTLLDSDMDQLRQRIIAAYQLKPISQPETREYIEHRLTLAGWRGDPSFTEDAYENIYQQTTGVPRRINLFCDRLLLYGYLESLHEFTGVAVQTVAQELHAELARWGTVGSPVSERAKNRASQQSTDLVGNGTDSHGPDSINPLDNDALFTADLTQRWSSMGEKDLGNNGGTPRVSGGEGEDGQSIQAGIRLSAPSVPANAPFIAGRIDSVGASPGKYVANDSSASARDTSQLSKDVRQFASHGRQGSSPEVDLAAEPDANKSSWLLVFFRNKFYLVLFIVAVAVMVFDEAISPAFFRNIFQSDTTQDETVSGVAGIGNMELPPPSPSALDETAGMSNLKPAVTGESGAPAKDEGSVGQGLALIPANTNGEETPADGLPSSNVGGTGPAVGKTQVAPAPRVDTRVSLIGKNDTGESKAGMPAAVQSRTTGTESGLATASAQKPTTRTKVTTQKETRAENLGPATQIESMRRTLTSAPVPSRQGQNEGVPREAVESTSTAVDTKSPLEASALKPPAIADIVPAARKDSDSALPRSEIPQSDRTRIDEQKSRQPETVASITPPPATTGIPTQELDELATTFSRAYAAGNLDLLLSLFSYDAQTNDQVGKSGIAEDYRELFELSGKRSMVFKGLHWKQDSDGILKGEGDFNVFIQFMSDKSISRVDGKITIYAKRDREGFLITRLLHSYD